MAGSYNIAITGISGQIGSRLSQMLSDAGIAHRGIDVSDYEGPADFLRHDLTQESNALKAFLEPVTHVIHLADNMNNDTGIAAWERQFETNVLGFVSLLCSVPKTIQHIAIASSMVVYGIPFKNPVDENHPIQPQNVYALGKVASERYLRLYGITNKIPIAILRYSSVYGPGKLTHRAIPQMVHKGMSGLPITVNGTGSTSRDYVYIDDVCRVTIQACLKCADGIYNVGDGKPTTIGNLAQAIRQETGCKIIYDTSKPDGYDIHYDITKIVDELGVTPMVGISEGIKEMIDDKEARP